MIRIQQLYKSYGREVVFDNYNLNIEDNKITCIMGPSGCGKSTLLNILAGLIQYKGSVTGLPDRISYVFQQHNLLPNKTLLDNVKFVAPDYTDAEALMELLGLREFMHKYPSQVSGGQRQRAAIARGIAYEPDLLLMDEPFSSVDHNLKLQMLQDLRRIIKDKQITCIVVTHDKEDAEIFADKIEVMEEGKGKK
ncbi:MAG: ABC transporter ATP-binding protein [Clostridia bacterium]|nr:ABC transporter ATP-binding protein [Clostridia bacterium]